MHQDHEFKIIELIVANEAKKALHAGAVSEPTLHALGAATDCYNCSKSCTNHEGATQHVSHEKKSIEKYLLSIKGECDFIMANIEKRSESRKAEESSLNNAKEQLYATPAYKAEKAKAENAKLQAKNNQK